MPYEINKYVFRTSADNGVSPIYVGIGETELDLTQDNDHVFLDKKDIEQFINLLAAINEL